jgi:ABC-type uncharacterized transport system ATPase subunit
VDARDKRGHDERNFCDQVYTTGESMPLTLETRDLTIRFGGHVAVSKVSCTFRPGELTAIVGPNGAGKTTYFNLISGQLRPSAGNVLLDSADITHLSAPLRTRAGRWSGRRHVAPGRQGAHSRKPSGAGRGW